MARLVLDVGQRDGDVPKQEEFVMDDKTSFLLWRGGRGSSKTVSGWARMVRRRWNNPKTKGICLAPDYNKLRDGVLETAMHWTDPSTIKNYDRSPPQKIEFVNDSVVTFYTASDPNVTRSLEANDLWFDEHSYCPHQAWKVGLGAKRLPPPRGTVNSMWATGTPRGYDWSYEVFGEHGNADHKVFVTTIYENRAHLPKGYIEDMEAEYGGTDFEEQELLGKYTLFEGLVYPQFDQGNIWPAPPDVAFKIGVGGIDLGEVTASVLVPLGVDRGQLWSPRELYARRVGMPELMQAMADFERQYNIAAWFCEPTADYFIASAREAEFDVRPCPLKDREAGIRIVQHYFRDNLLHIDTDGSPNGLRELRSYQHKPQGLGDSFSDTLIKANDHYPDALRYAVVGYELSAMAEPAAEVQGADKLFSWDSPPSDPRKKWLPGVRREKQEIGTW